MNGLIVPVKRKQAAFKCIVLCFDDLFRLIFAFTEPNFYLLSFVNYLNIVKKHPTKYGTQKRFPELLSDPEYTRLQKLFKETLTTKFEKKLPTVITLTGKTTRSALIFHALNYNFFNGSSLNSVTPDDVVISLKLEGQKVKIVKGYDPDNKGSGQFDPKYAVKGDSLQIKFNLKIYAVIEVDFLNERTKNAEAHQKSP